MELLANQDICQSLLEMSPPSTAHALSVVVLSTHGLCAYGEDDLLWRRLAQAHFGEANPAIVAQVALPPPPCKVPLSPTCNAFLETCVEHAIFASLQVVSGDIGRVTSIGTTKLDCLIFPSNSSLLSFGIGAAGAVFNRAGKELTVLLRSPEFRNTRRYVADAVATPGFDAGVDHLIHCVGPSTNRPDCAATLYRTYFNAFERAREVGATCIAIASISTGSLGFPVHEAATIAMRVYRDYIKAVRWRAQLAFVCYEDRVLDAMTRQRDAILAEFNVGSLEMPTAELRRAP
ncbi:hypothetical protein SPRG_01518 [Saprolegnia parasitica CBS 223.65]|uniref:Macro domain-containing protein n=1 Tax=Saprolegnia parasitica (strain CBS 223.65) TaxID=695850 RepID=A0A067D5U6_SAPPC|nr:hypothetical protein SPRG_01518 [Saprolegnia parasitica CBS 223.65]KDO34382.1 hypothetical protein SPRG_01518 [Saprolegnia parasitica CBS 223.65]|eukprot:XP_012195118.1 hypothetical protein SPRG_01518 [Saprolegnia parasitica CBS 223.65]